VAGGHRSAICTDVNVTGRNQSDTGCYHQTPAGQRAARLRLYVEPAARTDQKQVGNNPQPPRNNVKWRFRRTSSKLLKVLVAAVGLEPTTYGL